MRTLTAFLCLTFAVLLFSAGEAFALPPCPEDQNQRYHNCFGTYAYTIGDKYVGEWKNGIIHGQGIFTSYAGRKYIGQWKDGNPWHGNVYDENGVVVAFYLEGVRTENQ